MLFVMPNIDYESYHESTYYLIQHSIGCMVIMDFNVICKLHPKFYHSNWMSWLLPSPSSCIVLCYQICINKMSKNNCFLVNKLVGHVKTCSWRHFIYKLLADVLDPLLRNSFSLFKIIYYFTKHVQQSFFKISEGFNNLRVGLKVKSMLHDLLECLGSPEVEAIPLRWGLLNTEYQWKVEQFVLNLHVLCLIHWVISHVTSEH